MCAINKHQALVALLGNGNDTVFLDFYIQIALHFQVA